jgi:hypothetical protein
MKIARSLLLPVVIAMTSFAQDASGPNPEPMDAFKDLRDRASAKDQEFQTLKEAFDAKIPKTHPCNPEIQHDYDALIKSGTDRLNAYVTLLNARIELQKRDLKQAQQFAADYVSEIANKKKEIDLEQQAYQDYQRRIKDVDDSALSAEDKKTARDQLTQLAELSRDSIEELKKSVEVKQTLQQSTQHLADDSQLKGEYIAKLEQFTKENVDRWGDYYRSVLAQTAVQCRLSRPIQDRIEDTIKPIKDKNP